MESEPEEHRAEEYTLNNNEEGENPTIYSDSEPENEQESTLCTETVDEATQEEMLQTLQRVIALMNKYDVTLADIGFTQEELERRCLERNLRFYQQVRKLERDLTDLGR